MGKNIYNYELLLSVIARDNANIICENYSNIKLNKSSIILYSCSCGNKQCSNKFSYMYKNSGAFCKDCIKINRINKTKATNLKKYGKEYISQVNDIKNKVKKTNLINFGVEYGLQSKTVKDKTKATNLEKYGVEHISQTELVKNKVKETNLQKYGISCLLSLDSFRDKIKLINTEKYGVQNVLQSKEIRDKIKATNLEKYGVEFVMQNATILNKATKNSFRRKEIKKTDGTTIFLQGYEPQAYNILLRTYNENSIITDNALKPTIWWSDDNNKKHRYYPDFFIPNDNLIIEIKSIRTYLLGNIINKIQKTKEAVKTLGYRYEIWILDIKGNILQKIES